MKIFGNVKYSEMVISTVEITNINLNHAYFMKMILKLLFMPGFWLAVKDINNAKHLK